MAQAKIGP